MGSEMQVDSDTVVISRGKTPANPKKGTSQDHEDSAIHVCWDCNARFTRLEHLKRHITSLHITAPKIHGCEYCGKSFSRRDVLLRHHQSCRAAKEGQVDQANSSSKRPRQVESEQTPKSRPDTCTPGRDCLYRNTEKQLLSPRSEGDAINLSPGSYNHPVSPPDHNSHSRRSMSFQQGTTGAIVLHEPNYDNIFSDTPAHTTSTQQDFFPPNTITVDTTEASNGPQAPQRSATSEAAPSPGGRRPANKRGRYVSNACITCQKRKVKCSGEETCFQCRSADLACIYNTGRKRRNTTTVREETRLPQPRPPPAEKWKPDSPVKVTDSLRQMMERIESLERECNSFKDHVALAAYGNPESQHGSTSSAYEFYSDGCSPSNSSVTSLPAAENFHGATNLLEPIEILNRTMVHEPSRRSSPKALNQAPNESATTWQSLPKGHNKDLKTLEKETRMTDLVVLCHSVDVFFCSLNPHYPCINENQFRYQFQRFLENDTSQVDNADFYQFLALINLIQAETRILSEDWADSTKVPAWEEFCRAENILSHLTWLGNGNILTIQCLLIKARYLLYIEKADSAYDTMSRIVCLCFKLGLHDQPSWNESVTPFEVVMRQRIFWTIFYLERNIAFNCGAPYLIRESDFKVDLPKNVDDMSMYPGQPLPEETPGTSSGPYLNGAVKWGRLCSEIWDTVFGVNAQKPTSQEFIASIDARILYTMSQFPEHLQWERNIHRLTGTTDVPHYILRQTIILHLRMNQLRLLLRQETMLNMQYDTATAQQCSTIAASSIDAVHIYLSSSVHRTTDRWSSVLYLVSAILPLVCIIVKNDNEPVLRANAITSFKKGLSLLNSMSPNFSWARHTLKRIQRIIGTAKKAIEVFDNAGMFLLDPSEFFEEEMLKPRYTDFFNMDSWTSLDRDQIGQGMGFAGGADFGARENPVDVTGNTNVQSIALSDPDFPNAAGEMENFWVQDFLNARKTVFPSR